MNKAVIGIIVMVVLATGAFILFGSSGEDVATNTQQEITANDSVQNTEMTQTQQPEEQAQSKGGYVDYSEQALADASGSQRVVFFHAEWCSTCRYFEGQIEKEGVPDGITVLKADFDNDSDLKNQYEVNVQSTFVLLDENGEVVRTWPFASGLQGIQDLYDAVI